MDAISDVDRFWAKAVARLGNEIQEALVRLERIEDLLKAKPATRFEAEGEGLTSGLRRGWERHRGVA